MTVNEVLAHAMVMLAEERQRRDEAEAKLQEAQQALMLAMAARESEDAEHARTPGE